MAISTAKGIILLTGLRHAGIIIQLSMFRAIKSTRNNVIGGFHLFNLGAKDASMEARNLKKAGVQNLIGAHLHWYRSSVRIEKEYWPR
jgi:metal-dependent hydrolase (beta-lactamase superfamily II)